MRTSEIGLQSSDNIKKTHESSFPFPCYIKNQIFLERLRAEQSESSDYASETFDFFSETEVGLIGFFDLLQKLPILEIPPLFMLHFARNRELLCLLW